MNSCYLRNVHPGACVQRHWTGSIHSARATSLLQKSEKLMASANAVSRSAETPTDINCAAQSHSYNAKENYENLCRNMAMISSRPVSGYAGRWSRYQGASRDQLLQDGDIIYGFRAKSDQPEVTQVWKAEEGDLDSPKLQKQREQLPQLQKDPLQLQLAMDTLIVEVSAALPLLEPSLAADLAKLQSSEQQPAAGLSASMRVVAVPDWGNLVITGGLPPIGKEGMPAAFKTWFNRMYLRAPGPDGGNRWSVMLHYDTSTGSFLTHYYTWETAVSPCPDTLQQVFTPGAHRQLLEKAEARSCGALGNIAKFFDNHGHGLYCQGTLVSWDDNLDSSISTFAGSSSELFKAATGGPAAAEVWYDSGCYFRAPESISDDAVGGQDVVLEAGVVIPVAANSSDQPAQAADGRSSSSWSVVRWLLCYSSTGNRRIKWIRNEVHRQPTQQSLA